MPPSQGEHCLGDSQLFEGSHLFNVVRHTTRPNHLTDTPATWAAGTTLMTCITVRIPAFRLVSGTKLEFNQQSFFTTVCVLQPITSSARLMAQLVRDGAP